MHGGGLLHTTLTSSASAQGARVSLKSTDNFPLSSLEGSLSWCSGEKGWRLPATLFGRRPEEVKMQHPTRKYLRVSKKRRVSMRVFLTSMTIELGVKATKFDEER